MSALGKQTTIFDIPVCNIFQARILNDQLCYEVDLDKLLDKNDINNYLRLGFLFFLDFNEDRQVVFNKDFKEEKFGFTRRLDESNQDDHAFIYLNTIGQLYNMSV